MENELEIGKIIQLKLREQGRSVTWLANEVNCTRAHLYKVFGKSEISTETLWRISIAMDVNFFQLFTEQFKKRRK